MKESKQWGDALAVQIYHSSALGGRSAWREKTVEQSAFSYYPEKILTVPWQPSRLALLGDPSTCARYLSLHVAVSGLWTVFERSKAEGGAGERTVSERVDCSLYTSIPQSTINILNPQIM